MEIESYKKEENGN
jgi:hypothetical protein